MSAPPCARPCLVWAGPISRSTGYGIQRKGEEQHAHRVAYVETHGPIPPGLFVLHGCDNRACVEPAHLRLGTHLENMEDRRNRNRTARGERHGKAVLTYAAASMRRSRAARRLEDAP